MRTANKALILLVLSVILVSGSHNRGGFISWKITGPRTVTFSFTHAWRALSPDNIGVYFGDGSSQTYGPTNLVFSGTDLAGEAYNVYLNTVTKTYAGDGPYTVYWTSCCRVGSLRNAADGNFYVSTVVDLRTGYDSPTSTIPPLLQLPISATASYQIGVADPAGLGYSCQIASYAESGINNVAAVGSNPISVTSGCTINWNTAGGVVGHKYAVGITVKQAGTSTATPLDFIIELVNAAVLPTCSVAPHSGVANIGQPYTVTVEGTSTAPGISSLAVSTLGLSSTATVTPASGAIPLTVTFSDTPAAAGAYSTSIVFTDSNRRSTSCTVAYQVSAGISCGQVAHSSCSVSNGKTTYSLTAASSGDSFSWSSTCAGSFDSTTNGAVVFETTTNPNTGCDFSVDITSNGVSGVCTVTAACPLCVTPAPTCRVDQAATHVVNDPASIDKYVDAEVLAVLSDPDGAIVSTTSSTLPPGVGLTQDGQFFVSDASLLFDGSHNVTVTSTDVFGGVTTQVVTLTFLAITCGEGLTSCGHQCYNPAVHECLVYFPTRHLCLIGQSICNLNHQCCYDPNMYDCLSGPNGNQLCPTGNQLCDGVCFDPNTRDCLTTSTGSNVLCFEGWQLCADGCYDPQAWSCHAGQICLAFEQVCAGACFNPASHDCANDIVVPKGHQACGPTTYDPSVHVCHNGHTLCPVGLSLCGSACYNAAAYTCQPDFTMCPIGLHKCGDACYDDEIYQCCDPVTSFVQQIALSC